ncbi:MAG TPA: SDR family NAD(P)-dependent oxidoreductase [Steroidobacteraceae bacterium]|nr:SDR family NAD(P)-dependent oxidoreductase [Steroidobacteraceae bacterium]
MDLELKGRKAIVTGATHGIGLAIARQLAGEGVSVAICARTAANVERTVRELASQGVKAIGDAIDVTQRDAYVGWIKSAAERLGGLDIFVSNTTGTPTHPGETGWELGFQTDIMAAVRGCEAALPYLKRSSSGAIVLIASISGVMSKALRAPGILAYGSCKAALIAYGAQLSKEVAKEGIRVNMVSPGPIYFENGAWDHIKQRAPAAYEDALNHCVIGRLGKPEDIATAVAFLASPKSGFTVGQNLHVDGGYMEHIAF